MTEDEMKKLFIESIYAGQNDFGWFKSGVLMAEKYFKEKKNMTKEEAKQWAELLTAYAEGKQLQYQLNKEWIDAEGELNERHIMYMTAGSLRIKPEPRTRRMTNQELSDWLRDEPQEHRECMEDCIVYHYWSYNRDDDKDFVAPGVLIRRNHGKWEEPILEE